MPDRLFSEVNIEPHYEQNMLLGRRSPFQNTTCKQDLSRWESRVDDKNYFLSDEDEETNEWVPSDDQVNQQRRILKEIEYKNRQSKEVPHLSRLTNGDEQVCQQRRIMDEIKARNLEKRKEEELSLALIAKMGLEEENRNNCQVLKQEENWPKLQDSNRGTNINDRVSATLSRINHWKKVAEYEGSYIVAPVIVSNKVNGQVRRS